MTIRWPCIVVAALCGPLLLITSVHADGAWVLWARSVLCEGCSSIDRVVGNGWKRVGLETFGTEPECQTAALRAARYRYNSEPRNFVHPGRVELKGARVYVPLEFGDTVIISFECLPDTVDPREPKRK